MRFFLIVFIFCISSCNDREEKSNQLEQLQNIFGTANWQVVKGTDTSFIFFSPQGDNSFKTYQYNLFKGDSSKTKIRSIKADNGKVEWVFFDKTLVLDKLKDNETSWKDSSSTSYVLIKQNDSLLRMQTASGEFLFKRTLPLSTFLVRAKYDYEHGSKLIDSNEVKPHKIIR